MRELTFSGFLKSYVGFLSANGTHSIARLSQEAAETNPRLREPLLLYALWTNKAEVLRRSIVKYGLQEYYDSLLDLDQKQVELLLCEGVMPAEYQKVWNSYQRRHYRYATDNDTKALMRNKILSLQEKKQLSNYRIYTDLHLNPGNLNAWLKHGDCGKVSLKTARSVLRYAESRINGSCRV